MTSQEHDSSDHSSNAAPVHLVLGATGGIGRAVCRSLTADGARLLLVARNEERLANLGEELEMPWRSLDLTEPAAAEKAFGAAEEEHGRVDGVAHLVGSILLKPAHLTTDEEWRRTLDLNLTSAFRVVRQAAKALRREGGSVVLMSSSAARVGLGNHEAVAAAKAGVEGLARAAAATYAARGVRFNAVAPGLVDTPLAERITGNDKARKASEEMHALGRLGKPEDVAGAVTWLLDGRRSSWVTGQVFGVDGGLATVRPR